MVRKTLARSVTTWNEACDKRLLSLLPVFHTSCIHNSLQFFVHECCVIFVRACATLVLSSALLRAWDLGFFSTWICCCPLVDELTHAFPVPEFPDVCDGLVKLSCTSPVCIGCACGFCVGVLFTTFLCRRNETCKQREH